MKFFVSDIKEEILHYIDWINNTNEERKNLSKETANQEIEINENDKGIIFISDAKEGILGLIANNLLNKYGLPVVVLAKDEEKGFYKGSARAPEGFSIVDAFNSCQELTIAAGGHDSAGGCTIPAENIDAFRKAFIEYCNEH